ncbi:MAG: trypsin-like peptidase domain-containing protein [bacterium]
MRGKQSLRFGGLILIVGTIIGLIISSTLEVTKTSNSSTPSKKIFRKVVLGSQETVSETLLNLQNTSEAFIYIAELVVPTVVTIQSTRLINTADLERFHNQDELRDFFRFRRPERFRQQGSGSGIIVSDDGYILTNVHVIDKAEKVQVILYDNREFQAEIVGLDPLTEVAVIKINANDLPVAKLGDSDRSRVGEWVLAVGNPLELRSTVTAGIISAKERQIDIIRDSYSVENFIQTDAAINPGNSGGALVNLNGQVIGVNTAIATETGYNAGFGFAIPINLAKKIMDDLINKGRVERGFLGIAMQNIDERKARALEMDRPRGVFIDKVLDDSPAETAGLKPKDVILKIGDEEVSKSNQVQAIIARKNPGENINLTLLRKGKELNVTVMLGLKESEQVQVVNRSKTEEFENLGITCESLTAEKASEIGFTGREGALVSKIERWSPAEEAGIRKNDVITEINDSDIKNADDFLLVFSELQKGDVVMMTVVRGGEEFHLFIELP